MKQPHTPSASSDPVQSHCLGAAVPAFAPDFTREPLARFGCCHCGHVGDYPATPAPLPCPECGQPLQALPIAPKG